MGYAVASMLVSFRIRASSFMLGAFAVWKTYKKASTSTLTLFFLIAYHYSLMGLSTKDGCHSPGFLVLDFPAELEDGTSIADKENFVLEPFVELFSTAPFRPLPGD